MADVLRELRLRGLGVIEDAVLELGPGLTALTGETGAGKTMVTTGVGLLLGTRADAGAVRAGASRAVVEGRFDGLAVVAGGAVAVRVDEAGGELDDGELLVARQVTAQGRSRAFIGGAQTSVATLTGVTSDLVTIHGQSEQVRLGDTDRQRDVLDRACGAELARVLDEYRQAWRQRREMMVDRDALAAASRERAQQADLLRFGLDEIAAVDPQPGEDTTLANEAARLQAIDDLRLLAGRASAALSGDTDGVDDAPGALGLLVEARKALDQTAELDPAALRLADQATELGYLATDLATEVASYLGDLEADPLRLESVTARRAALSALLRKYGATLDEVLGWAAEAADRLTDLSGTDDRIAELSAQVARLDERLAELAATITQHRTRGADTLATAVQSELSALAMPHARLVFQLTTLDELGPHGAEHVALLFTANPGAEPAPLGRVASGGELSRVRLALEVTLADADPGHTFVFDEVDAGVGGAVALEIGRRLARLAERSQVLVVTHLAQVAAFADAHHVVDKSSDGEVTTSDVRLLDADERLAELARMMAGLESSESALGHARELLAQAGRPDPSS